VRLEPPTFGQIARLVGSTLRMFSTDEQRLDAADGVVARLELLVGPGDDADSAVGGGNGSCSS
jgi:hypothetical protein